MILGYEDSFYRIGEETQQLLFKNLESVNCNKERMKQ